MDIVLVVLLFFGALALGFANGANDNSKGVATLVGGKLLGMRSALIFAAVTTGLGSLAAIWIGAALAAKFKGAGIVIPEVMGSGLFAIAVAMGAAVTVLLATRIAIPISTTHAIVGAIIGVGVAANGVIWYAVWTKFFYPLLASPLIAVFAGAAVYLTFKGIKRITGISQNSCVCIDQCEVPAISGKGQAGVAMAVSSETLPVVTVADAEVCRNQYEGRLLGIPVQSGVNALHLLSAGALSFARGLNDTPKVAALLIGLAWLDHAVSVIVIGVAIAAGGLLFVRRVAETMSHKITAMHEGQALSGNLAAAFLVLVASKWGVPVSTTHVTCGSLFGIGAVTGQARWKMIGTIVLAWVTTLPVAAILGALAWWGLNWITGA